MRPETSQRAAVDFETPPIEPPQNTPSDRVEDSRAARSFALTQPCSCAMARCRPARMRSLLREHRRRARHRQVSLYDACCSPQRRRFRNNPFREMPSSLAASSTRPFERSRARRTRVCSSASTACRQRLIEAEANLRFGGVLRQQESCVARPGSPATAGPASRWRPARRGRSSGAPRWRADGCCPATRRAAGTRATRR